jgi:membrane-associated protease RseP (regulator of RpoE activity)
MKQSFRLFNFQGSPVSISIWFFLLFLILPTIAVVAVFISVLIHELAHAWMANQKGYKVYGVSIDILFGSASIDSNIHDRDSIPIAAAGPISTLMLCVGSYILEPFIPGSFVTYMFNINLFLFVFNILPIYPMDGGQIVRSLANLSRNRYRYRRIADWISLTFSCLLLFYSLFNFNIFMALFSVYFGYLALKELEFIK